MTTPTEQTIYQVEVKLCLAKLAFPPAAGWRVNVHLDPMELARGGQHAAGKRERAAAAAEALAALGATIGQHDQYGRVDLVADHVDHGRHFIEVEGNSSRQRDQALYSCLGQLLLTMMMWAPPVHYGIAVPHTPGWHQQLSRIPRVVRERLSIDLYLVGIDSLVKIGPNEDLQRALRT
ncbi:MAG: hypothetical protein WEF50_00035 [Myxococcota bacterium]